MQGLSLFRLLWRLSLRNLYQHRVKSFIVGFIMFFGTFLVVIGTSLLDSVQKSMAEGITSSLAGHIQIYDANAKDKLALFGGEMMGAEDIGRIEDFGKVLETLSSVENIKTVIPMGIDMATVTSLGELERTLSTLRDAVRNDDKKVMQTLSMRVREIAAKMKVELKNREKIAKDKDKIQTERALLERVTTDTFWGGFHQDPISGLEFLDTKIAPLTLEGRIIYFRYLGTDLDLFRRNFDRFEIVRGEMVPEGKRGFLFNQKFYDDWVKNYVARGLDKIHRGVVDEGKEIAKDPLLQALARQTARQYRRITYQLDDDEARMLESKLRTLLPETKGDLSHLLQAFLTMDDANFRERYAYFYKNIAPLIDLYEVDVGDVMTIRAFTRSGYLKAVNVKVYGTFRFRGLEKSDLAGGHSLMDLVTFRELYGLMTEDKLKELADITNEVGLKTVGREDAEAALFGEGKEETVELASDDEEGFDEFEGVRLLDAAAQKSALLDAHFDSAVVDRGLALNGAIVLKDSGLLEETMGEVQAALKAGGLDLQTVDWQSASGIIGQFIIVIRVVLYIAITIIFLVALVIINNSMVMATMERVTEIGTMRAMGARRRLVLAMFIVETVVLGVFAGLLGIAFGGLVVEVLGYVGIPAQSDVMFFLFGGPRLFPALSSGNLVFGVLIIMGVSVLSTLYPATIATRVQPVVAMQARE